MVDTVYYKMIPLKDLSLKELETAATLAMKHYDQAMALTKQCKSMDAVFGTSTDDKTEISNTIYIMAEISKEMKRRLHPNGGRNEAGTD